MNTSERSRFDTRLPREQKEFFDRAATLGGFRTLSEFVIFSAQQQANDIIARHNAFLASKKDQEIFFEAIMNPQEPNDSLKKSALRFKKAVTEK